MKTFESWKTQAEVDEELFSPEDLAEMRAEVDEEARQMFLMQEDLSRAVAEYMAREHIGFNEMLRRLRVSPRQLQKIIKGSGNLTLGSISRVAVLMGKRARIVFDENSLP